MDWGSQCLEGECTPRLCFRGVIRGTGIDGELSPTAPGGSWQILNSSVSTTVAASSVCQNPCPACVRDENTLSPGLEFWLQNGFCFLPILTWGREQPYSKEKLLLSGGGGGAGVRQPWRESVPEKRGGKEAKRLSFGLSADTGWCGHNGQHETGGSRKSFGNK